MSENRLMWEKNPRMVIGDQNRRGSRGPRDTHTRSHSLSQKPSKTSLYT